MRRELGIYTLAWTALIAIYAAALIASGLGASPAIRNAVAILLPDAILGVLVLRLPSFVATRDSRFATTLLHAAALITFVLLGLAGWLALVALDGALFDRTVRIASFYRFIPFRLLISILIYGTLAGIAYVREHAERAARAEALRARAALEALRSQVNPHFLLNTYHAVLGLVRRDPALAESALEQLGDLLRYSVRVHRDGIDEVPLREECAFAGSYLALEQLRLAERLHVRIETAGAEDLLVPTFAVQLLVENAIRHAIAPRAAGGRLEVRAEQLGGRLRVSVTDEGDGEVTGGHGNGLGLRILQERLAMLYGSDARFALHATGGGTRAELELPARRLQ